MAHLHLLRTLRGRARSQQAVHRQTSRRRREVATLRAECNSFARYLDLLEPRVKASRSGMTRGSDGPACMSATLRRRWPARQRGEIEAAAETAKRARDHNGV